MWANLILCVGYDEAHSNKWVVISIFMVVDGFICANITNQDEKKTMFFSSVLPEYCRQNHPSYAPTEYTDLEISWR